MSRLGFALGAFLGFLADGAGAVTDGRPGHFVFEADLALPRGGEARAFCDFGDGIWREMLPAVRVAPGLAPGTEAAWEQMPPTESFPLLARGRQTVRFEL